MELRRRRVESAPDPADFLIPGLRPATPRKRGVVAPPEVQLLRAQPDPDRAALHARLERLERIAGSCLELLTADLETRAKRGRSSGLQEAVRQLRAQLAELGAPPEPR